MSAIRQANGIRGSLIHPGADPVVPRSASEWPPPPQQPERRIASGGTYVVQRNDTLWDIARSFGTSVDALCAANGLSRGATIRARPAAHDPAAPAATSPPSRSTSIGSTTYTVRRGDTLYDIARRFGVSVSALRRANGLTSSRIYPGDVLQIPGSSARG